MAVCAWYQFLLLTWAAGWGLMVCTFLWYYFCDWLNLYLIFVMGQSFWVDRPTKQARTKDADEAKNFVNPSSQDRDSEVDVPLYDRVTPSLSSQETRENGWASLMRITYFVVSFILCFMHMLVTKFSTAAFNCFFWQYPWNQVHNQQCANSRCQLQYMHWEILKSSYLLPCRHIELQREATRCFNCGSYSHALRDCQRPRNYDAINSARSNHNSKKAFPSGPRVPVRYYQTPAGGKDDDERKPGGPARETREPSGVRVCICEKLLIIVRFWSSMLLFLEPHLLMRHFSVLTSRLPGQWSATLAPWRTRAC